MSEPGLHHRGDAAVPEYTRPTGVDWERVLPWLWGTLLVAIIVIVGNLEYDACIQAQGACS